MSGLEFVASIVSSLAWPVVVLIILLLFKGQVSRFLETFMARRKGTLTAGPVGFSWDDAIEDAREDLEADTAAGAAPGADEAGGLDGVDSGEPEPKAGANLVDISPRAAVIEAFGTVEDGLANLVRRSSLPADPRGARRPVTSVDNLRRLRSAGLIGDGTASAIDQLRTLRNVAVHARDEEITRTQAIDYVDLAASVSQMLELTARME